MQTIFVEFQDNVFVTVVASVQYRALSDKASDAFYKLSNTKQQVQAYVFDGKIQWVYQSFNYYYYYYFLSYLVLLLTYEHTLCVFTWMLLVIRASVPKLPLDDVFLQKNDIARGVEEELEKVNCIYCNFYGFGNVLCFLILIFVGHVWVWFRNCTNFDRWHWAWSTC